MPASTGTSRRAPPRRGIGRQRRSSSERTAVLESPKALVRGSTASGAMPRAAARRSCPVLRPRSSTRRSAHPARSLVSAAWPGPSPTRVGCRRRRCRRARLRRGGSHDLLQGALPEVSPAVSRPPGTQIASRIAAHRPAAGPSIAAPSRPTQSGSPIRLAAQRRVPVGEVPLDAGIDGRVEGKRATDLVTAALSSSAAPAPGPNRPQCRCRHHAATGSPNPSCRACGTCLRAVGHRRSPTTPRPSGSRARARSWLRAVCRILEQRRRGRSPRRAAWPTRGSASRSGPRRPGLRHPCGSNCS